MSFVLPYIATQSPMAAYSRQVTNNTTLGKVDICISIMNVAGVKFKFIKQKGCFHGDPLNLLLKSCATGMVPI